MLKNTVRLLWLTVLTITFIVSSSTQGFASSLNWGSLLLKPSAKIGYQRMATNFSVAIEGRDLAGRRIDLEPLDLTINRIELLVGHVALEAAVGPYSLFVDMGGNPVRTADVRTTLPNFFEPYPPFVDLHGRNFQWWQIDAGAVWKTERNFCFLAGFKMDHLSTDLGSALIELRGGPGRLAPNIRDSWTGDILMKMWIPYLGLQVFGDNYKCNMLASPFSWNDVKVPFRLNSFRSGPSGALPYTAFQLGESQYYQKSPGVFLEGDFTYSLPFMAVGNLGLWINGQWARFTRSGNQDVLAYRYVTPGIGYAGDSGSGDTVLSRYSGAIGLVTELSF